MSASRPGRGLEDLGAQRGAAPAAACGTGPARPGTAGSARRARRRGAVEPVAPSTIGSARPARRTRSSSDRTGWSSSPREREQPLPQLAAGPVQPDLGGRLARCPARRRWPRGAGRRRRAARRRPAAASGSSRERVGEPVAHGRGVGLGLGVVARAGVGERRVVVEARRGGAGRACPSWVAAQLAVIRYSQVENCASPRKRFRPSVGPEIRLLHHVARILLVAGQAVGERVRVGVRRLAPAPRRPAWSPSRAAATRSASLWWHRGLSDPATGERRYLGYARRTSAASPCGACGCGPSGSTSSSRCARGRSPCSSSVM